MGFLKKILGRKDAPPQPPIASSASVSVDPAQDPNMIRVYDQYGREVYITRQNWRESVLRGTLSKAWNNAEELYVFIVSALQDGFRSDIVQATEHLYSIDPRRDRATCLWGIVLMEEGRLDEAEGVLSKYLSEYGDDGTILTNLAKVYAKREDYSKAEEILWRGLHADPNQSNGVGWYEVIHREKQGREAGLEALRRVAVLPGSWRAQLWLARAALEGGRLEEAASLYDESLLYAPRPVPADLLMQLSGDLGNKGHLPEILRLCEPHFVPAEHGIQVGNNLIKTNLDLGRIEAAQQILNQLYALKRPDWQQNLSFWDTEIAKAKVNLDNPVPVPFQIGMLSVKGPIWLRDESPATELFPAKDPEQPTVCFLGSTAEVPGSEIKQQLSDMPGRLSRMIPLFLSEQVHWRTEASGEILVPWIVSGGGGFVLGGVAWEAEAACDGARQAEPTADYVVVTHLRTKAAPWTVELSFYRTIDRSLLGRVEVPIDPAQPSVALMRLFVGLGELLKKEADIDLVPEPSYYQVPEGADFPYYLLRLEQALAVSINAMNDVGRGSLNGEREILNGNIQLCLNHPSNTTVRLLLAQTLRKMREIRPDVLEEFAEKTRLLQKNAPLPEPADGIVQSLIESVFST